MNDPTTIETISKFQNVDILSQLKTSLKQSKSYTLALPIINSRLLLKALALYAHEVDNPFLNIICAKLGLFDIRKNEIKRYVSKQLQKQREKRKIDDAIEVDLIYTIKHLKNLADDEKKKGNTYIQEKIMESAAELQHLLLAACVIKNEVI